MREQLTRPPKTQKLIAIALQNAHWPAWAPRPASPEPVPEVHFESELPTVAEVLSQTASHISRAPDKEDSPDRLQDRVAMVRLIGQRFREAREMSGFSQLDAALQLGYKNSSKLAKVENGSDTFSVPTALIIKAAALYEVSADYLLGISLDWDVTPDERHQRQVGRWLFDTWQTARERDLATMSELSKKVSFVASSISAIAEKAESVQFAFDRLRSLNANFDDLIAGQKLVLTVEALVDAGRQARLQLRRLHVELAGNTAEARP